MSSLDLKNQRISSKIGNQITSRIVRTSVDGYIIDENKKLTYRKVQNQYLLKNKYIYMAFDQNTR